MMSPAERQAIEQEIDALRAYVNAGPEAHMVYRRRAGWTVFKRYGVVEGLKKRAAVALVELEAAACRDLAGQLRARLTADDLSREIAATPIEERQASSRAQAAAIDYRPFRRTA